jgi:UDP-3-O-[3-hydroxymyristoyl] glucosamine N-acyltransferase
VTIGAGAVIGEGTSIGDESVIHPNVTIAAGCRLGRRVVVHSGTVIGSDGYGYATDRQGNHVKRAQLGTVRIDDDVEIGANCCIDRATFGETWIQSGTKIDNLVQVAHNVEIGPNCLLVAQTGLSGSTTLGRNVVMGGQSSAAGHLQIGDGVMVAARGGIHNDQPAGAMLGGAPAIPAKQWRKCCAVYNSLPELREKVRRNSKAIAAIQSSEE